MTDQPHPTPAPSGPVQTILGHAASVAVPPHWTGPKPPPVICHVCKKPYSSFSHNCDPALPQSGIEHLPTAPGMCPDCGMENALTADVRCWHCGHDFSPNSEPFGNSEQLLDPTPPQPAPDRHEASRQAFEALLDNGPTTIRTTEGEYAHPRIETQWIVWCRALDHAAPELAHALESLSMEEVNCQHWHDQYNALRAENKRLREQITDMRDNWRNIRDGVYDYPSSPALDHAAQEQPKCGWTPDLTTESWDTDCGRDIKVLVFDFEGKPGWCPGCGRRVERKGQAQEQPAPEPTQGSAREWVRAKLFEAAPKLDMWAIHMDDALELADRADAAERRAVDAIDERDQLKYVFDRNRKGMEEAQELVDSGCWAGYPLIEAVNSELKACRAQLAATEANARDWKIDAESHSARARKAEEQRDTMRDQAQAEVGRLKGLLQALYSDAIGKVPPAKLKEAYAALAGAALTPNTDTK